MTNMPVWAFALALLTILFVILNAYGPSLGRKLEPTVIAVDEALSQFPQGEGIAEMTLARTPTGSLGVMRIETAIPSHYHRRIYKILYVISGSGKALYGEEEFELRQGRLLIVFAGTVIRLERLSDEPLEMLVFSTPPTKGDIVYLEDERSSRAEGLKPMLIDVGVRMARGLEQHLDGFEFTLVFESPTGSVGLFRLSRSAELHHPKANHLLYITKGRAKGTIGTLDAEIKAGQVVVIPAGVRSELKLLGGEHLEFIMFSTPLFVEEGVVWH